MDKFIICINSSYVRDAEIFDPTGIEDDKMDDLDYHDCSLEDRWSGSDVNPFICVIEADDETSACKIAGDEHCMDPRILYAIKV